jgi:uracil-DNA glycosylase family 4
VSSETGDPELAELLALTREHLLYEMDLGTRGLPRHAPSPRAIETAPAAPSPPAARPARAAASPETASRDVASGDRAGRLRVIADEVRGCTKCGLHAGRTQTVFARGNPAAELVFVGEGPGYNEDQTGLPFVGQAGQLLDKMIGAMGFAEDEVYICNVVKCRPPENRTPNPDEAAACMPYLRGQLEIIAPKMIVALGRCAAENLGLVPGAESGRGGWRGVMRSYAGIPAMPTYHPAYLLRNPEHKRVVWQDLQAVVKAMGRELPAKR